MNDYTIIMINSNNVHRNEFTYLTEEKSAVDCTCVCVPFICEQLLSFLAAGGLYISTVGTDLAKNYI